MESGSLAGVAPIRVCFPFAGDKVGGSHVSAAKLIQNFDRRRVTPVVVLQQTDGALAPFLQREGIDYLRLPLSDVLSPGPSSLAGLPAYLTRTLPFLRRFLREGQFDVVHTNDARAHVNWGLAARLAGAKLVWHHRGDPDAKGANFLAPLIVHQMVTVSRFARPNRPLFPIRGRVSVIHSPFEQPSLVPDRRSARSALLAELGLPPETRVLGYFGNLVERKRPLLFVDIVHRIRQQHPQIPIVGCLFGIALAGRPDLEAAARQRAAALGIGDAIRLMGFRQPIEPYMAATDILLVPSIGEPFGRTLIEAMFLGTPVVAVDHGGNPEAIEDGRTGFLVEPENADAFVSPIVRLLSEPALFARIGKSAQDAALRSYSVAGHVEKIMDLYDRITGRGAREPRRQISKLLVERSDRSHAS